MLNCTQHPDRPGVGRTDPLAGPRFHCAECWATVVPPRSQRAYATGLGPEAHAEAQEAGRYAEEYERMKPYSKDRRYL